MRVRFLLAELHRRGLLAPKLVMSSVGGITHVSLSSGQVPAGMFYDAVAGADADPDVAVLKCLAEYLERMAFQEYCEREKLSEDGTTGFAAFPSVWTSRKTAAARARENAYCESLERYAWNYWWDHDDVALETTEIDVVAPSALSTSCGSWVHALIEEAMVKRLLYVVPRMYSEEHEVVITFAEDDRRGVAAGGACGRIGQRDAVLSHALGELFSHLCTVRRSRETGTLPVDLYERRLRFFGIEGGCCILWDRLNRRGDRAIAVPQLAVDCSIEFSLSDLACVHRCLFRGQSGVFEGPVEKLVY